jgi:hypothetical protein
MENFLSALRADGLPAISHLFLPPRTVVGGRAKAEIRMRSAIREVSWLGVDGLPLCAFPAAECGQWRSEWRRT